MDLKSSDIIQINHKTNNTRTSTRPYQINQNYLKYNFNGTHYPSSYIHTYLEYFLSFTHIAHILPTYIYASILMHYTLSSLFLPPPNLLLHQKFYKIVCGACGIQLKIYCFLCLLSKFKNDRNK